MKKIILLSIIPVYIFIYNFNFNTKFWKGSADPTYGYLLNGENLAYEHDNVGMYQHPGSTVTAFSALMIQTIYKIRSIKDNLRVDVLKNPEIYIKYINLTLSIGVCFVLFLLGYFIDKVSKNILYGLLMQSISIISSIGFFNFSALGPDPILYASTSCLVLIFILHYYYSKSIGDFEMSYSKNAKRHIYFKTSGFLILISCLLGFSFATKINSLPLFFLPLFFILNRNLISFSFFVFLSFILFTLPIANHYDDFLLWIKGILTHSGAYGSGENKFIDLVQLPKNIYFFTLHEPIVVLIIFISLVFVIKNWSFKNTDLKIKLLASALIVQLFGFIMIFKHFEMRYFTPIYPTLFINILMIFELLNLNTKLKSKLIISFIFISFIFTLVQKYNEGLNVSKSAYIPEKYNLNKECINIYSEGCFSKVYALKFGDFLSNSANADLLKQLYGQQYFYIIWEQKFYDWKKELTLESLFHQKKKIYFYAASRFVKTYNFPFNLKLISHGKYLLTKS